MAGRKSDFTLPKFDDIFSTQEMRDDEKLAKIRDIPLELIDNFPDHPYRVQDDEDMDRLVESRMRCTSMFLSEEDGLHETRQWKRWAHQELQMVCRAEGFSFFAVGDYENALWSFEEAADLIERFWQRPIPDEYALLQGPGPSEGLARLAAAGCLYKLGRLEECDAMMERAYHLIRDCYDDALWEKCKEQRMKEYRWVYHKVGLDEYKPCI